MVSVIFSMPGVWRMRAIKSVTPRRTSGSPPVIFTFLSPMPARTLTIRRISPKRRIRSCAMLSTPSSGIQYRHLKLHRSVTEMRI